MSFDGLCLGIDLGITSVKVALLDCASHALVFSTSEPTKADSPITVEPLHSEQNVDKILSAICTCLTRITSNNRALVKCIGVSGQMHGVLLWNSGIQKEITDENIEVQGVTNLITWHDRRATAEYLSCLPKPDSHQSISAGFGCVSLFWLKQFEPEKLLQYDCFAGITDYFVAMLCSLDKPVITQQVACSWGYFSTETNTWNMDILQKAGFPVHMLPVIVESGSKAGNLCTTWFGIPKGTPVLAGLGDLQCSFISASKQVNDAVINISTSAELSYPVLCTNFKPPRLTKHSPISYFPFFKGRYLAVAASLNGGNVLTAFMKMLQKWFLAFGVTIPDETIWQKLKTLAQTDGKGCPIIQPVLFGERYDTSLSASVAGITAQNSSLDRIFKSLCEGLVKNLHFMMPNSVLIESGISRLVISGSVGDRQPYIKECIKKQYAPLTVIEGIDTDAARGAAIVACRYLETLI